MRPTLPPLFDANASYGTSATEAPECPTLADRLAHMDRLGIRRALVWNVAARQDHPLGCNRQLLDDLRATPGTAGRIVPALSVSGLIQYERDGVAELRRQLRAGRTRALRWCRGLGTQHLAQTAPVLQALRDLRPFVVTGVREFTRSELLEFAARCPGVPVIVTGLIWGTCAEVYDLMRRCPNLLADLSWQHTWDNAALMVRAFGARRVVFGTGYRSHNGAAIGVLARAPIGAADRRLIAHGNLDRLLGDRTAAAGGGDRAGGAPTFWGRFLAGQPLDVDVVDAHAHLGASGGYVLETQEAGAQVALALKAMPALGLRLMISSGLEALLNDPVRGNDALERLLRPHADRLKGYVAFNPIYADALARRLDRWFAGPVFVGFKTLCDYWRVPITDPRFRPMWDYAERRRLPVLMHTWGDSRYDGPALLGDLVQRYRNIAFLLGHAGGTDAGRLKAEALAVRHANVYLEWCGSFCSARRWEDTLRAVPARQVVFGTDAMAHGFDYELGRLLSLDAPDRVLAPILGATMRRILARRRA